MMNRWRVMRKEQRDKFASELTREDDSTITQKQLPACAIVGEMPINDKRVTPVIAMFLRSHCDCRPLRLSDNRCFGIVTVNGFVRKLISDDEHQDSVTW